jgi:hypothetical protein
MVASVGCVIWIVSSQTWSWTLRLLAEQMVELKVIPELSHETVCQTLKKECALHQSMIYGYARVSTGSQSEAAQVAILKKHGA